LYWHFEKQVNYLFFINDFSKNKPPVLPGEKSLDTRKPPFAKIDAGSPTALRKQKEVIAVYGEQEFQGIRTGRFNSGL